MHRILWILVLGLPAFAQSDQDLKGEALVRFEKSKGASHAGADVRWDVPSKAFAEATRARGGYALFVYRGVGILVEEGSTALAEVRRRGGTAVVRGTVRAWPAKDRKPGDPAFVVVVRDLNYKRKSAPKKGKGRRLGARA